MNCDCSCDIDGDCAAAVSTETIRIARKDHVCTECGETIKAGETYERFTGLFDGSWDTFKTCMPCRRIRQHYCCRGWYYGFVAQQIEDCLGFDYRTVPDDDDEKED